MIVCPISIIVHCIFKKPWSKWFYEMCCYFGNIPFVLFLLTFTPFAASVIFELRYHNLESEFDVISLIFACVVALVMVIITVTVIFLVLRHHTYRDVDKIRDRFTMMFLPFRPPFACSLYWPGFLVKTWALLICLMIVQSVTAHKWILFSLTVFSFLLLVVVRALIWWPYFFDVICELVNLALVCMIFTSDENWAVVKMVLVFLLSVFIFFFSIFYMLSACYAWYNAKARGRVDNPNVIE